MADYRRIIPFIKKVEGGLSRDPEDPAAAHPAPCTHNGQLGWHTNKGITYQTFISNTDLGYAGTCENFFSMPEEIWMKIFKSKIWDPWQLDKIRSQSIADNIVDWSYNSGAGGAWKQIRALFNEKYKMDLPATFNQAAVTDLRKKINSVSFLQEYQVRKDLLQKRFEFIEGLNNPKYEASWKNRIEDLNQETRSSLITSYVIKGLISFFALGTVITGAILIRRAVTSKRS